MKTRPFNLYFYTGFCLGIILLTAACEKSPSGVPGAHASGYTPASAGASDPNQPLEWKHPRSLQRWKERLQMVERIRNAYGLDEEPILEAMRHVPRHWFVPDRQQRRAYIDSPLPIGHGQTISQPFIVAYMTSILSLDPNDRVLEVGTGSGYQAAVLNEFTPHVYTIEIVRPLGISALHTFKTRGYKTIRVAIGDGYEGWPEHAPFDAIIVTCAPEKIPPPLTEQLKSGGKMIIPVGSQWGVQELVLVQKDREGNITRQSVMPVRFVPLIRQEDESAR